MKLAYALLLTRIPVAVTGIQPLPPWRVMLLFGPAFGSKPHCGWPMADTPTALRPAAVTVVDRACLTVLAVQDDVVSVRIEIAEAVGQRDARLVAITLIGDAVGGLGHRADEVLLQDDVDDAGDGVRAVDRGRAVLDDVDVIDHLKRNLVQVDVAALRIVGEHADVMRRPLRSTSVALAPRPRSEMPADVAPEKPRP